MLPTLSTVASQDTAGRRMSYERRMMLNENLGLPDDTDGCFCRSFYRIVLKLMQNGDGYALQSDGLNVSQDTLYQ